MICWCDICESLVSWSVRTQKVSCDGCDRDYTNPIADSATLKRLVAGTGALMFSYAPDQSEAVAAVIAAGPFPRVTIFGMVEGYLGSDSLAKGKWGDLDNLLKTLPDVTSIELAGQFDGLTSLPNMLQELRLRGSVDSTSIHTIAATRFPELHTLEIAFRDGTEFTHLLESLQAPSLKHLAVEGADLTSADAWSALQNVVDGLLTLKVTSSMVGPAVGAHVDALAARLTHLNELALPEDCFTAELARLVPHADFSY